MFKVIKRFVDLQDDNHLYEVGETYPRTSLKVSESRLHELASSNNKQHQPLIEELVEEVEEVIEEPKEEEKKVQKKKSKKK